MQFNTVFKIIFILYYAFKLLNFIFIFVFIIYILDFLLLNCYIYYSYYIKIYIAAFLKYKTYMRFMVLENIR